jgi:23S rRNA pseudouridine1911/1915/1917 synthase
MSLETNNPFEDEEEKLFEHYSFTVDKGQGLVRIDRYLTDKIENLARNRIQNVIKNGGVLVNDVAVKSNYKVKPDDQIKIVLPYAPQENFLIAENIPLNIVYEDDDLLVVNKPAGMVVHPGHGNFTGTLLNGLIYHFENLPKNADNRPGLVHRIDKDTTGLLVIAKKEHAITKLAQQFADKTSTRKYLALVWGDVKDDEGTVEGNLGRNPKNRLQVVVFPEGDQGKHAVTHYKVIERFGYVTLLELQLETGRTHQIRAHMKYIGHTLFNDERYGGNKILKGTTFTKYKQFVENTFKVLPRQALHAKTLGFVHPSTNEFVEFNSEIPEDMQQAIERWRKYAIHKI